MGLFSTNDQRQIRDTVRRVESIRTQNVTPTGQQRMPLPVLGKADTSVAKFAKGTFSLYENKPDAFVLGDGEREAYALCALTVGDDVELKWVGGTNSSGYWGATKCGEASTVDCDICQSGISPAVMEVILSGLTTALGGPAGIDWASFLNATHTIPIDQDQTTLKLAFTATSACGGEVIIDTGPATVTELGATIDDPTRVIVTFAWVDTATPVTYDIYPEVSIQMQYDAGGGWTDFSSLGTLNMAGIAPGIAETDPTLKNDCQRSTPHPFGTGGNYFSSVRISGWTDTNLVVQQG